MTSRLQSISRENVLIKGKLYLILFKQNISFVVRAICLSLTALAILVYYILPDKKLNLLNEYSEITLYDDSKAPFEGSVVTWVDNENLSFRCIVIDVGQERFCGLTVKQKKSSGEYLSLDLTRYTDLNIRVNYKGHQSKIILFYRNTDNAFNKISTQDYNYELDQFIYTYLEQEDLNTYRKIGLDSFDLADWWLEKNYKGRSQIRRGRERITEVGIATYLDPPPGIYDFQLVELQASGKWLTTTNLYLYIIIIWVVGVLFEGIIRFTNLFIEKAKLNEEFKKLEESSVCDPLTCVYNRAGLLKVVASLDAGLSNKRYYIFIFDIDNFKLINDTYGHPAGDEVLRTFASVMTSNIREDDYFARWGGEEFILLSSHKSADSAYRLGEKLRLAIASTVFKAEERPITVTTSIGIAKFESPEKFDHSLVLADQQLYRAKNTGKNKVCFYSGA
ncbi:hypothetical protein MARGE09_P4013 [Marinagarivorans cellulosilyticus]|uniref:diguanylate cyclase n=1 Tax=Marinagarivorans cellulosilyticus TaxID=2721545 RepID=A0AAN2BM78_9GAMM|nr:hypothetical protein MARGE09_P4013 [Marinagarivorans cellulosilyticus]